MNTPLPYLQLIQHFSQYIQPKDKRHLTVFGEIVSAILLSGSASLSHWRPFLSHRHCKAPSGTLKNFGAKIASNTVRVRDLGKRHKNG
ncbi:hypothetical protein [Geminocystis sp. NIES-3709]|uniref:hypothetical protein n=1 Tax=Geminocystis sp. NIES-3709 TaxID=1617448 RepID=UPI0005FCC0E1|nr:hypothetical protein [Geminocystis sp. NIES-3709]BAQ66232.1 hypothetical protein GM3709_2997 [Geminocystis sp. NIES-3709]